MPSLFPSSKRIVTLRASAVSSSPPAVTPPDTPTPSAGEKLSSTLSTAASSKTVKAPMSTAKKKKLIVAGIVLAIIGVLIWLYVAAQFLALTYIFAVGVGVWYLYRIVKRRSGMKSKDPKYRDLSQGVRTLLGVLWSAIVWVNIIDPTIAIIGILSIAATVALAFTMFADGFESRFSWLRTIFALTFCVGIIVSITNYILQISGGELPPPTETWQTLFWLMIGYVMIISPIITVPIGDADTIYGTKVLFIVTAIAFWGVTVFGIIPKTLWDPMPDTELDQLIFLYGSSTMVVYAILHYFIWRQTAASITGTLQISYKTAATGATSADEQSIDNVDIKETHREMRKYESKLSFLYGGIMVVLLWYFSAQYNIVDWNPYIGLALMTIISLIFGILGKSANDAQDETQVVQCPDGDTVVTDSKYCPVWGSKTAGAPPEWIPYSAILPATAKPKPEELIVQQQEDKARRYIVVMRGLLVPALMVIGYVLGTLFRFTPAILAIGVVCFGGWVTADRQHSGRTLRSQVVACLSDDPTVCRIPVVTAEVIRFCNSRDGKTLPQCRPYLKP